MQYQQPLPPYTHQLHSQMDPYGYPDIADLDLGDSSNHAVPSDFYHHHQAMHSALHLMLGMNNVRVGHDPFSISSHQPHIHVPTSRPSDPLAPLRRHLVNDGASRRNVHFPTARTAPPALPVLDSRAESSVALKQPGFDLESTDFGLDLIPHPDRHAVSAHNHVGAPQRLTDSERQEAERHAKLTDAKTKRQQRRDAARKKRGENARLPRSRSRPTTSMRAGVTGPVSRPYDKIRKDYGNEAPRRDQIAEERWDLHKVAVENGWKDKENPDARWVHENPDPIYSVSE